VPPPPRANCRLQRAAVLAHESRGHRSLLAGGIQILQMSFSAPAYRLAGGLARRGRAAAIVDHRLAALGWNFRHS
jgi:hypothetical protein